MDIYIYMDTRYQIVPGTRSCQVPDLPGRARSCQVPDRARYQIVPGTSGGPRAHLNTLGPGPGFSSLHWALDLGHLGS